MLKQEMCFLRDGTVTPQCQAPVQRSTPHPHPGVSSLYEFKKKQQLTEAQSLPSGQDPREVVGQS